MGKALLFFGAIGAGAAALYLLDEKEGKKRRARLRKKFESGMSAAEEMWDEYSDVVRERYPDVSRAIGARAQSFGKSAQDYLRTAGERASEWSKTASKEAPNYAKQAGKLTADYAAVAGKRAGDYVKDGSGKWSPSVRMIGAVGSALAFYGAGRPGLFGIVLRTLSLGLFTRALLASR
jgi:gas vesicle protein